MTNSIRHPVRPNWICPRCGASLEWGDMMEGCKDWLCPVDESFWDEREEDDDNGQ